jgi:hypothetical protein
MTTFYGGMIPSRFFEEGEFEFYLNSASAYELENDLLTLETLGKMYAEMPKSSSQKLKSRLDANAWNNYLKYY